MENFPKRFEKYYKDHFGFRNKIVKIHNFISYFLFKVSPSPQVIIGKEDWLFLTVSDKKHGEWGSTTFDELTLAKFSQVLKDRELWLHSIGSHYLYLPIPNKSTVYQDYLPDLLRRYRGETKYEQVTNYLTTKSDFSHWLDTKKLLEAKKNTLQVYFKTDTHWNYDGAYEVYLGIIEHLRQ